MPLVRLDSVQTTFLLEIAGASLPRLVYWGDRLPTLTASEHCYNVQSAPVFQGGLDVPYQLNIFPETGTGFRGSPALTGERAGRDWAQCFSLVSHRHKPNEVIFYYEDKQAFLSLILEIKIDEQSNVLQRRTTIKNTGSTPYNLQFCAAASMPVPSFCDEIMKYHGCWSGEFMTRRSAFQEGMLQVENRTGRTSHDYFPAILCGQKHFNETQGKVFGLHLGWSGNFKLIAEHIPDGTKQLQIGELFFPGEGIVQPGEKYVSPWAYAACSSSGLGDISNNFHTYFRANIETANMRKSPRLIQFNTWEAVYFDHDIKKLTALVDKSSQLGIERFVLDDGWFHGRHDDSQALGDWWPDEEKYPEGLSPLVDHVKSLGMQFGLWVEPEMVNEKSMLFRDHPDWILSLDGFARQTGRNQLVLNLCKPEVFQYLYLKITHLLKTYSIDYLKWDMNRILTEAGYNGNAVIRKQTFALYALIDKIRKEFPHVEIEACASGGARVDYAVLSRTERLWASDSNDPFRRLAIQSGLSVFFPPEVIGSHIGPELCHTSGRVTNLDFRALSSLVYHFGCELDLLTLKSDDEELFRWFIEMYKNYRNLFHQGRFIRLDKQQNNRISYGVVGDDSTAAVFFIHQIEIDGQSADRTVLFAGLAEDLHYTLEFIYPTAPESINKISAGLATCSNCCFSGTRLMQWGVPLYLPHPGTSVVIKLSEK